MHPLMFIDFAMWLNPAFKVKVLKFVSDQMLSYRNEVGEAYKQLASGGDARERRLPEEWRRDCGVSAAEWLRLSLAVPS